MTVDLQLSLEGAWRMEQPKTELEREGQRKKMSCLARETHGDIIENFPRSLSCMHMGGGGGSELALGKTKVWLLPIIPLRSSDRCEQIQD